MVLQASISSSLHLFSHLPDGRHVIYGVQPEDFTALVQCFMEVLPAIFGSVLVRLDALLFSSYPRLILFPDIDQ